MNNDDDLYDVQQLLILLSSSQNSSTEALIWSLHRLNYRNAKICSSVLSESIKNNNSATASTQESCRMCQRQKHIEF